MIIGKRFLIMKFTLQERRHFIMNFLKKIFSRKSKTHPEAAALPIEPASLGGNGALEEVLDDDYVKLGIAYPAKDEEKELVCIITAAIMAENNPNTNVRVRHVYAIDEHKEAAALVASAIAADNQPNSCFKLKGITQL